MLNEDDFYYILTKNGTINYYSKLSGSRIAKKDIPIDLVPKIKIKDSKEERIKESVDLLKKKVSLQTRIASLQDELKQVNDGLRDRGIYNKEDEEYAYSFVQKQEEILRKRREFMFYNSTDPSVKLNIKMDPNFKPNANKFNTNNSNDAQQCKSSYNYQAGILEKYNISDKKAWKDWLRDNHVDKGGDNDICAHVIAAGKSKGW